MGSIDPMMHTHITGPMGAPRPLSRCSHLFTVQIEGREPPTSDQLDNIESQLGGGSVGSRPARFGGNFDITIKTGDGISSNDEIDEYLDAIRGEVIDTHQIVGWRVESV